MSKQPPEKLCTGLFYVLEISTVLLSKKKSKQSSKKIKKMDSDSDSDFEPDSKMPKMSPLPQKTKVTKKPVKKPTKKSSPIPSQAPTAILDENSNMNILTALKSLQHGSKCRQSFGLESCARSVIVNKLKEYSEVFRN